MVPFLVVIKTDSHDKLNEHHTRFCSVAHATENCN